MIDIKVPAIVLFLVNDKKKISSILCVYSSLKKYICTDPYPNLSKTKAIIWLNPLPDDKF